MPEGSSSDAQCVVAIYTRKILMNILDRTAYHEIRFAVGMLQLCHVSKALADILGVVWTPSPLHIACCNEIAKIGIEDSSAECALQGMARCKVVIYAHRVAMVVGTVLPVLFCGNLLRTEIDGAESVAYHEAPFADGIIQLRIQILIVGVVGVISHTVLLDRQSALETGCKPEILRNHRSGIFHYHKRIGSVVAIRCRTGICRISAVVADVLGTQGKEDARSLFAQQAGIVCLEMVGAHIVGWRTGNMVSGVGLHRIHFQHVLLSRSPEDVHLGSLVRIVIDEA